MPSCQKIAKIVHDVQRFQVPYNFVEIPEVQSFLHNGEYEYVSVV